jgi:tRNA G18 (ribose-2'-O)-methylase SpoU
MFDPAARPDDLPRSEMGRLRAAGFRLLALTLDRSATPLGEIVPSARTALLFGTEGDGLSSRWRREAHQSVRIPMHPGALAAGVDLLNVVAAAAIACHVLVTAGHTAGGGPDSPGRNPAAV